VADEVRAVQVARSFAGYEVVSHRKALRIGFSKK
jgi:hypothetical protein